MSLATRLTLVVVLFLGLAGTLSGLALYHAVEVSLARETQTALETRLGWLAAGLRIEVDEHDEREGQEREDPDDAPHEDEDEDEDERDGDEDEHEEEHIVGRLWFDPPEPAEGPDISWRIAHVSGRELWSENWTAGQAFTAERVREVLVGDPERERVDARHMRREAHDEGALEYYFEGGGSLPLRLEVRTSTAWAASELDRLALALWTIGPLALLVVAMLVSLLIRWQLRPLAEIGKQAERIGPADPAARIGPVGSAPECISLRESMNRMVARLADGIERERQFGRMAAHELRTPLAQLRTHIEVTLRKPRQGDEYREALDDSLADVLRLQQLVVGLLELARAEREGPPRNEPVSLQRLLDDAARSWPFERDASAGTVGETVVTGQPDLLLSALTNVLENAARYAPGRPPQLRLVSRESQGEIELVVSDSGEGVPAADRDRIFEPLTRLDTARSIGADAAGYGLGLAIARTAMRACGGELACRDREDGEPGAEFVLRLRLSA